MGINGCKWDNMVYVRNIETNKNMKKNEELKNNKQNDIRLRNIHPALFSYIKTQAKINQRTLSGQVIFMLQFFKK